MIALLAAILVALNPPTLQGWDPGADGRFAERAPGSPRTAIPSEGTTVSGVLSSYGRACRSGCLALPGHRWGQPGLRVVVCGPAACIERTSTDAGPALFMQRPPHNRIADLALDDWNLVCGCRTANGGLVRGTVRYVGRSGPVPTPPATSTEGG